MLFLEQSLLTFTIGRAKKRAMLTKESTGKGQRAFSLLPELSNPCPPLQLCAGLLLALFSHTSSSTLYIILVFLSD